MACLERGIISAAVHVDHIKALVNAGDEDPHDDSNRQGLCEPCHAEKTRRDLGQQPRPPAIGPDGFPIDA